MLDDRTVKSMEILELGYEAESRVDWEFKQLEEVFNTLGLEV